MGILKHIINEVINEDDIKKEIELYKANSKAIEDLQNSIKDTLEAIKAKNAEENQRLKFIIKYMEDFKVSKVEGDNWVASLEEVAMYKYPSISYKEVYEKALSKLNDATKNVLKQVESEHLADKRQMKKKELVIKESLVDKGINWLLNKWKGLLLSMKSYKSTVKALPSIKVNEGGYKRRRDNKRHNDKLRNAPSPEQNIAFNDIVKKSKEWELAHKKDKGVNEMMYGKEANEISEKTWPTVAPKNIQLKYDKGFWVGQVALKGPSELKTTLLKDGWKILSTEKLDIYASKGKYAWLFQFDKYGNKPTTKYLQVSLWDKA